MKKKIFTLALALILLATAATGTLAYFTSEDQAHNVITTNGIDIQIKEYQQGENGLVPYPDEEIEVMPGAEVSKIVKVLNLEEKSWIRANFVVKFFDQNEQEMAVSAEEIAKIITIATGEKWTAKDGWYYYNEAVKTGAETEALFEEVVFSGPNMGNEYQNCTVTIDVYAQAVQSANNGETALEAAGWK